MYVQRKFPLSIIVSNVVYNLQVVRDLCREFKEHFIVPTNSDVLVIENEGGVVNITCEDGSRFR